MKLTDERYVLSIAASHEAVRLRDHQTGEIHEWTGARALYDALGVLAEWRERDTNAGEDDVSPHAYRRSGHGAGWQLCWCGREAEDPIHAHKAHYGVPNCEACGRAVRVGVSGPGHVEPSTHVNGIHIPVMPEEWWDTQHRNPDKCCVHGFWIQGGIETCPDGCQLEHRNPDYVAES